MKTAVKPITAVARKEEDMNFNTSKNYRFLKSLFLFLTLSLSGFTQVYSSSDTSIQPDIFPGWPKSFHSVSGTGTTNSVVLADLDSLPDLEVIGGFPNDSLYVWRYDGSSLTNWPVITEPESAYWQQLPAIGDMDGDGELDIIITKWQRGPDTCYLYVFHQDGSLMQGFPVIILVTAATAPALYDLTGDGKLEIITAGQGAYWVDTLVYIHNYRGEILPGWPQRVAYLPYEYIAGPPAVGDLDGDGEPEIVATGSQCIYAWNVDGTPVEGWPVKAEKDHFFGWLHHVVLSDLDNDGYLEVLACAFHDYPIFTGYVAVWRYDGTYMPGFPKYYEYEPKSTPIPGDIDNDGYKEIVFVTGEYLLGLPNLHVLNIDGTEQPGWPIYYPYKQYRDFTLADIDGNNSVDVVLSNFYAYNNDGTLISGEPLNLPPTICPNFNDINGDSILDVAIITGPGLTVYLYNLNVPYHPDKIKWGKFYHDNYNTNNTEFGVIRKKGDFNNNGYPDIADVMFLLNYLFRGGKKPGYPIQADVNCDSHIDVVDLLHLYNYLYKNGKPLCSP